MTPDYYGLLGVEKDASSQDIKRAYRQIARECHPDVNGGDAVATERFKEATLAYETLMDPVARARYDRRGQRKGTPGGGGSFFDAFFKRSGEAAGAPKPANEQPKSPKNARHDPRNNIGLDDLFGDFGFGRSTEPKGDAPAEGEATPQRGADVHIDLDVPTNIARTGGSVTAVYHRLQRSDSWRPGAPGPGLIRVEDIAEVRIVPGTVGAQVFRERGLGDAGSNGGAYGDLVATVRLAAPEARPPRPTRTAHRSETQPPQPDPPRVSEPPKPRTDAWSPPPDPVVGATHADTQRDGGPVDDGSTTRTVDVYVVEALLGGRITVDTPQGRVKLSVRPGTSSGTRLRLKGKGPLGADGLPSDLTIVTRVVVPSNLDDESRRLIEEFARLNPGA